MSPLDAATARSRAGGPSFSRANRIVRLAWIVCWAVLAAWTPRQFGGWRRLLLRAFGASMGDGADVRGSARIWLPSALTMGDRAVIGPKVDCYNQALVTIGDDALISQGAYLCAGSHDVDDPMFQLIARPIVIGRGAWIAAQAFVGPGAVVGDGAVLGARSVAFGALEANMIYTGNPARILRKRRIAGR